MKKLTTKQRRFVEAYEGNAAQAASDAGYKGNRETLKSVGSENLAKPYIREAIKAREEKRQKPLIATREERQEFWSRVMSGKETEKIVVEGKTIEIPVKMSDRLRAAELLGKSEADFIQVVDHRNTESRLAATRERILAELKERHGG